MGTELENLYNIYKANIQIDDLPITENLSPVKVGDILVAMYKGNEIRGEVSGVYESHFFLKGKNGSSIKITMDDVTEHYPKNRAFENKAVKRFTDINETVAPSQQKIEKPIEKIQQKKKNIIKEEEDEEDKNTPDNQVDLTIEKVKTIGKLIYFTGVKFSDINTMFEKRLLNKENYWYLLTEKSNEIHVIRNNSKAFEIQPFMNALVGHFLKDRTLNESASQIKVAGNNEFSVVSNIPQDIHKQLLNSLIALLSGIKK